ncbi:VOC family protein [Actinokineospora spheciospongiae]|uniref:VOC family protein n=1 Tax=Actinokineospora spheciospongiae TaxID=909613 RepID=UPI000D71A072|nr:VOC family protein [Actinokineospora spheciospongiae]PWW58429.1 hypothetical protein DFQ13_109222 [Actinokineospora spheciospongiae]
MPTRMVNLVVDAADPAALARFWAELLRWSITATTPDEVDVRAPAEDGWQADLVFVPVDPGARVKVGVNRWHLDLPSVSTADQLALVDRAVALGATPTDIGQGDVPWVVLADPEGNEFCVLDPRPEYADTGSVAAIIVQSANPNALADFWAAATGHRIVRDDRTVASLRAADGRGPWLEFLALDEPKSTKNRLHIDVAAHPGENQLAEVARLRDLGATPLDIGQGDVPWVVLADPEGNEFCVLTSR